MALHKEDFTDFKKEKAKEEKESKVDKLLLFRQASVKSTKLVGSSEWDTYLSHVQSIIDQVQDLRNVSRNMLESPKIVNYEKMIECKMVLRESQAIVDTLKQIINLPYAIIHDTQSIEEIKSNIPLPEPPEFATKA